MCPHVLTLLSRPSPITSCNMFMTRFRRGTGIQTRGARAPQLRLAKRSAIQANAEKTGIYAGLRFWNVLNGSPCAINDLSYFPVNQIC